MNPSRPRRPRRSFSSMGFLDLLCMILSYVILAQLVGIGTACYRRCDGLASLETSIKSVNSVVYLLRASGGNFSDALTPEQIFAKYEAAQSDEVVLTIHSILTCSVMPARAWPETSKADQAYWNAEFQRVPDVNAVAG